MKEVLVLGGGGFIGRNIVEFLVNRGDCNVTAADIKEGSNWHKISNDESTRERFKAILADFTEISAFDGLKCIVVVSPKYDTSFVLGLINFLGLIYFFEKVPKPLISTFSSNATALIMDSRIESIAKEI